MPAIPVFLPPTAPPDLLSFVVSHCSHPTTLLVCSSRSDFVSDTAQHLSRAATTQRGSADATGLLQAPLYQVAVARHIRVAFIPTVSHLRAFLAVFTPGDNSGVVAPPPPPQSRAEAKGTPLLLVYGFVRLHRDTSEWSAHGLSLTAAGLVAAARRTALRAVVVDSTAGEGGVDILAEAVPMLGGAARGGEGSRSGRVVGVRRVLVRWFRPGDAADVASDNVKGGQ